MHQTTVYTRQNDTHYSSLLSDHLFNRQLPFQILTGQNDTLLTV